MTFERWRFLFEAVGLGAVVCSIIFLTFEIRQNTQAMRAAAIQESTSIGRQQLLALAANEELNRLSIANFAELDAESRQRVVWIDRSSWFGFQGLFRQWQLGVLADEDWAVWQRLSCALYTANQDASIGRGGLWSANKAILMPDFVELIESSCTSQTGDQLYPGLAR